jgi:hypothetical protein
MTDNYFKVGNIFIFFENSETGALAAHEQARDVSANLGGVSISHFRDPRGIALYARAEYRHVKEGAEEKRAECKCRGQCPMCEQLTWAVAQARHVYVHSGESRLIGEGL